jgi:flagellar protein FliJ
MMKSRDLGLRSKRFEVAEKARKAADLEMMIRDFENMAVDLNRQITAEEDRTGVKDPSHFSYSTFAKSVTQRRDNLMTSIEDLRVKLEAARREHDECVEELQRLEASEPRESERAISRQRGERNAPAG